LHSERITGNSDRIGLGKVAAIPLEFEKTFPLLRFRQLELHPSAQSH